MNKSRKDKKINLKVIQVLKKPNFLGILAIKIIKFGGWLFEVTGNSLK